MAYTQPTIESLKELNLAENTKLRNENAKSKQALEVYEARFANLEQKDKEKSILIVKLDDDIKEIKQSSVNTTPCDDTPEQIENISDNASNSDICQ